MINKESFINLKKYKDFRYWFRIDANRGTLQVYDRESRERIAVIEDIADAMFHYEDDKDILFDELKKIPGCWDDWFDFIKRPELDVYDQIIATNVDDAINAFEWMLIGTTMVIAENDGIDPDTTFERTYKCLEWLRTTDFYTCPSSRAYHDANHAGLLMHTLKVTNKVFELYKVPTFANSVSLARALRAALLHDWCKIGLYESFTKNVKNESTGNWEQETAYRYKNERSTLLGHGVSSMYLAGKFFKISYEEALAIRWHMGEFNVAVSEMEELSQSCRRYPLVYMLQFADRLACVEY